MKNDIGIANIPLAVDNNVMVNGMYLGPYLHEQTIKKLEEVPFLEFSGDTQRVPQKITSLGRWRFLEGYLTAEEQYWSKVFKDWFKISMDKGLLGGTRNCEGCIGSFVTWESKDLFNLLPGFWSIKGAWYLYNGTKLIKRVPPMSCQAGQFRFNRRIYIQKQVYGDIHLGPPEGLLDADMAMIIKTRNLTKQSGG